jgi:catechol 2,3-dioxygenase
MRWSEKAMQSETMTPQSVAYRPRRVGHVNLWVEDFHRSMNFYHEICGLGISGYESKIGAGFLSNGSTHHDIGIVVIRKGASAIARRGAAVAPAQYGEVVGLNHLGWEMETEAELVAAYQRARAVGFPIHRTTDQGSSRSTYVFDEDGVVHQFYADMVKDWRTVFTGGELDLHANPPWTPGSPAPHTERRFDLDPEIRRDPNAPLHPLRIAHSALVTPDLARARRFYVDIAGLAVAHEKPGGPIYLRGKASVCDLIVAAGSRSEQHHAAFEVDPSENLDAAETKLAKLGVPVVRSVDTPFKRSIFIRDPDGIVLEFFFRRASLESSPAVYSEGDLFLV